LQTANIKNVKYCKHTTVKPKLIK